MTEHIAQRIAKVLTSRYGTHPMLDIPCLEWLESTMHAKTVKFDIGSGGNPPEVTWEDRCAAIAMIRHTPARSLAHLLVWGYNPEQYEIVKLYMAGKMVTQCRSDGKAMPKGSEHGIEETACKMAGMVLDNVLYNLWDLTSVEGRLVFGDVGMNDRTYSNQMLSYQRLLMDVLASLVATVERDIESYKKNLSIH